MNFILANTGRTASRAFYLNLKSQKSIAVPSRYLLDKCISDILDYDNVERLKELSDYYKLYYNLMKHWNKVLPGFVIDCHYENIVSSPRTIITFPPNFIDTSCSTTSGL